MTLFLAWTILSACAGITRTEENPPVQASSTVPGQSNPANPADTSAKPARPTDSAGDEITPAADLQSTPSASLTPPPPLAQTIWLDPLLPEFITQDVHLPEGWHTSSDEQADISISFGKGSPSASWILALTAPFPTLRDDLSAAEVHRLWLGTAAGDLTGQRLILSGTVFHALTLTWGETASSLIQVMDENSLLQAAWDTSAFAIIPFERLEPGWKVISIDGDSPIHNDFNPDGYALNIPITLQGEQTAIDKFIQAETAQSSRILPASNRDASKLTVLVMTGVTALVRATAYTMQERGITYPGQSVQNWLTSADITHISNEASFAENCPPPNPNDTSLVFCSNPGNVELLEYIGTDLVELTGDHLADWGQKALYLTLDMYKEEGWLTYGGGYNLADGRQAVNIEHNGNKLAFIGCNAKGAAFATATNSTPGAVLCDFPYIKSEISRLLELGYLPIVSIQHNEYNLVEAQEIQQRDFRRLAESGAVIIMGSQSHLPQGMEFYKNTFLHYGLGNLFFDQYLLGKPFRQGIIDRHVFYDNRYISTELLTTTLVDFAQPQPMSLNERTTLLGILFSASGW